MTEKELRQKFVNMAESYVGVKEGSSQHKNIVDTYNKIVPLPQNYKATYRDSWCAIFVSAIAAKVGMLDIVPAECSCNRMIALAKKMGIWVEKDSYVPNVSDLILYDWNDNAVGDNTTGSADHVGIVVSVADGVIKVIEGNYQDAVGYRSIVVNGRYIRGFITPKFSSKVVKNESVNNTSKGSVCSVELNVLKKGAKGKSVKALQALLVGFGYSVGSAGIDGDFGNSTVTAVKKYQTKNGLEVDGVVGSATWTSLLK